MSGPDFSGWNQDNINADGDLEVHGQFDPRPPGDWANGTELATQGSIIGPHIQPGCLIALVSAGKFTVYRVTAVDHQAGSMTVDRFPSTVDVSQVLANMAPQPAPLMNPQIIDAIHDFTGPGELT